MKNILICVVVTGKTIEEFLENLEETQGVCDLMELRVDYIDGFSANDIDLIKSKIKKRAIFTCRKREEGGFFAGTESERIAILKKAVDVGFDYVDVEVATALSNPYLASLVGGGVRVSSPDKGKLEGEGVKVILSFHDFKKTPSLSELNEIKKQMKSCSACIMKFATMVKDDRDIKVLLQFLLNKQEDEEMIVVGMGEKGKIIRVIAPFLGSYFTYASTEYSQTASGQIEIGALREIYDSIESGK